MSDEARLQAIERRLEQLERLLDVEQPRSKPTPPVTPPPPPAPPEINLEELFGGRILAWLGSSAVVVGVVFFLVMAVSRGWIDEPTRVALAFLGSTALLGLSLWLHERKGQTQASLAL